MFVSSIYSSRSCFFIYQMMMATGFVILSVFSCRFGNENQIPDVSGVTVDFKCIRFDRELMSIDTSQMESTLNELQLSYPSFTKIFLHQIVGITDTSSFAYLKEMNAWITDSLIRQLHKAVQIEYPVNDEFEREIKHSLQFMKYYFPKEKEPVFYSLISGLSYGNFIFQDEGLHDGIGIGLDFFLGRNFNYGMFDPSNPAFSAYLVRAFNRDHLLKKTWEVWIEDRLPNPENGRLLDYMMHRGKKYYTLKKFIPTLADTVLFEFTPKQLQWCLENKVEMWSYFMNQNLLYSTEILKFNKYINPSPASPGMPSEAPGQTGSYIGLQIIEAYMKKHPDISLPDLWALTDSQALLNNSKFKPRNE